MALLLAGCGASGSSPHSASTHTGLSSACTRLQSDYLSGVYWLEAAIKGGGDQNGANAVQALANEIESTGIISDEAATAQSIATGLSNIQDGTSQVPPSNFYAGAPLGMVAIADAIDSACGTHLGISANTGAGTSTGSTGTGTTGNSGSGTSTQPSSVGRSTPYASALQEWEHAACASSAQQGAEWTQVAADLKDAAPDYAGNPSGYKAAINDLHSMALVPETSASAAQQAQFESDVRALDIFLRTPGLLITAANQCPGSGP